MCFSIWLADIFLIEKKKMKNVIFIWLSIDLCIGIKYFIEYSDWLEVLNAEMWHWSFFLFVLRTYDFLFLLGEVTEIFFQEV